MLEENITTDTTLDNSFSPKLAYFLNSKLPVTFEGNCILFLILNVGLGENVILFGRQ